MNGAMEAQIPKMSSLSKELADAVRNGDRDRVLQLLQEGANPFDVGASSFGGQNEFFSMVTYSSNGFDVAGRKRKPDIGLLLHMFAKPGTLWENRFLVSRHESVLAPLHGRSLQTPPSMLFLMQGRNEPGGLLRNPNGVTMEALELLLVYGYTLSFEDFETILGNEDTWKELLALVLAAELPIVSEAILNKLMSKAIGSSHFIPSRCANDPLSCKKVTTTLPFSNLDLATAMLKSGADPNALYVETHSAPENSPPYLIKALQNEDEPMINLLIKYGARIDSDGVMEMASQVGLKHLLVANQQVVAAPGNYGKQLRKQFMWCFYREVKQRSALLTVACIRQTGLVPQKHLMSNLILEYCPLGFNLWKVGKVRPSKEEEKEQDQEEEETDNDED